MKLFISLLFFSTICFAQQNRIAQYTNNYFNKETPQTILFKEVTDKNIIEKYSKLVTKFKIVTIDEAQLKLIMTQRKQSLNLLIPFPDNTLHNLKLVSNGFNDKSFIIKTSTNESFQKPSSYHYRGIIDNDENSIAAVSFFENDVMGVISKQNFGNINIGKIANTKDLYIIYSDIDLVEKRPFNCANTDEEITLPSSTNTPQYKIKNPTVAVEKCIKIYLETDFALYTDKGSSSANVTSWVTGMFNVWAAVYQNEGIKIEMSELYIWSSADPFNHTTSTTGLNSFDAIRTTFNGDYAHLLSKLGGDNLTGGLAWLGPSCSDPNRTAYSGIDGVYQNLPTYSQDILIVSHEFGHNLGSHHTHWCGWPGGPIDNCYAVEGTCSAGPAPTQGTIMSYCHLTIGTNLALGFGPLPNGVILNEYNTRPCLQQCQCAFTIDKNITNATCSGFTNGAITTTITGGSGTLYYNWSNGSTTYTTQNLSNITSGDYTLTVTQGSVCAKSQTATVLSTLPNPNIATVSNSVCLGGTVTISASGANTYTWSNGVVSPSISISPTVVTTYTCLGSDSNGCVGKNTATVAVNNVNFLNISNSTICYGESKSISPSGGTTFTWSTGSTAPFLLVTPSVTTTYSVFGKDANGCRDEANFVVTVNNTPTLSVVSNSMCSGAFASLSVNGSATTYSWSTTDSGVSITVSPSVTTNYTCTGTTSQGCSAKAVGTVSVLPNPTITISSGAICLGNTQMMLATGATNYVWNNGATTSSIVVSPSVTTSYTCTGTYASGCSQTSVKTVTVYGLPNVSVTSVSVCTGKTGVISASGANTYNWNTGATTYTIAVSPTTNTTYTVLGTSVNGCTNIATSNVYVYPTPSLALTSGTICYGMTATVSAAPALSYTWSNGSHSSSFFVVPNATTVYTCTGASSQNCPFISTTTLVVVSVATPSITQNGMTLTSSSSTGNQWYLNNVAIPGATGQIYTATQMVITQ